MKWQEIDIMLFDLRDELERKYEALQKNNPTAPITHVYRGKLEMLEEIECKLEELKDLK